MQHQTLAIVKEIRNSLLREKDQKIIDLENRCKEATNRLIDLHKEITTLREKNESWEHFTVLNEQRITESRAKLEESEKKYTILKQQFDIMQTQLVEKDQRYHEMYKEKTVLMEKLIKLL